MKALFSPAAWAAGVAVFSMFFGAGNVIFPLSLGLDSGTMIPIALFGLLLTGIGSPLLGLFGAVLYEGDCKAFFNRMGDIPGYVVVILIFALIGPFGAMPRALTVSYDAVRPYFPGLSLFAYSQISALFILICIAKHKYVLPVLGWVLSPLLLLCLGVIIAIGVFSPNLPEVVHRASTDVFLQGLNTGYDMMDLLASVFFSVAIWNILREKLKISNPVEAKTILVPNCILAIMIGGTFLGIVYIGLGWASAVHMPILKGVQPTSLLPTLAVHTLGPKFALMANIAIALACLTTVMGLAVTIADVIRCEVQESLQRELKFNYGLIVFVVMFITAIMSNLGFMKIMAFLHPIMQVCYPAIIVLTICNILYKLYGFKYVKFPVYLTLAISLVEKIYEFI